MFRRSLVVGRLFLEIAKTSLKEVQFQSALGLFDWKRI